VLLEHALDVAALELVDEADLSVLHVFPFSPREGTPAARMPQIERADVKSRAARLRAKGSEKFAQSLAAHVGRGQTILVEKPGFGRTPCFVPVVFDGHAEPGTLVPVHIRASAADHLIGSA
jgi:threonylcarbamoyladenosine tRNA methylthiotransferase MtaB